MNPDPNVVELKKLFCWSRKRGHYKVIAPEKLNDEKFRILNTVFNGFDLALERLFVRKDNAL
ncbi:MAG: hypothetical protein IE881_07745 [Epsilonproteobacteria bacterium]|nr:hypothetical protein [Campylobacterota bacterium]